MAKLVTYHTDYYKSDIHLPLQHKTGFYDKFKNVSYITITNTENLKCIWEKITYLTEYNVV
jgi:hypothetical protein